MYLVTMDIEFSDVTGVRVRVAVHVHNGRLPAILVSIALYHYVE